MQPLKLWNDRIEVLVSQEAQLAFRFTQGEQGDGHVMLREGKVQVRGAELIDGLLYYDIPCCFESLVVRQEGVSEPLLQRLAGNWPTDVDDDQLELYPQLHYLEQRKTGLPWRYERWYSLVGAFLVFESEQYFERSRPKERGKNWVRLIVQLRQIVNLADAAGGAATGCGPLLSAEGQDNP
jgi:hypothetical protein